MYVYRWLPDMLLTCAQAPTMPLYILAHLTPPEDIAGGIWFDESKEYDSVFVDSLRMVVYKYVQHKVGLT